MKKLLSLLTIICLLFSLVSCKGNNTDGNKLTVAVSIIPQATFVEKVAGDTVKVITMIPAGADAESYEPTFKEITALSDSKLYFSIGIPSEDGILPHINEDTQIVDLAEHSRKTYNDITIDGGRDPHIWLSPKRVIVMIEKIKEKLTELCPDNAEIYKTNAENYIKEIKEADRYAKEVLQKSKGKTFFVFHPAFGYLADEYGLKMKALEEHGKEATAKELAELTDLAKSKGIEVIFCQAEASKKQAEVFAGEIGGRVEILEPLSPDYTENLKKTATMISKAAK